MAIDFYDIADLHRQNCLFGIEQDDYDGFENVFLELKKLTGIFLDPYGKTRISGAHIKLIVLSFQDYLAANPKLNATKMQKALTIMDQLSQVKEGFIVIGD